MSNKLYEKHLKAIDNNGDNWEDSLTGNILTDYFDKKLAAKESANITREIAIKYADWITCNGGNIETILAYNSEGWTPKGEVFDYFINNEYE